jgi:Flp pilus assembly protein protease CpaA
MRLTLYIRRVDYAPAAVAALPGLVAGWLAVANQHYLYRQEEFRQGRLQGRRALAFRVGGGLAAGAAAALAFRPDHYEALPAVLTAAFCLVFVIAASTDFERRLIPDKLTYPAMLAAIAVCWAWPDRDILEVALGALVGGGGGVLLFGFGILAGRGGIGFGLGDVKLMFLMGLVLGWPFVVSALIYGILLAGLPAIALILMGRSRTKYAYGPYLSAGAVLLALFPSVSAY